MGLTYLGELFILMMERVGLIVLLAVLLVHFTYFKKLLVQRNSPKRMLSLIILFGFFAILSNLVGIQITSEGLKYSGLLTQISPNSSIANTRSLAIGVSGFVGGPWVGSAVGLIAGVHRFFQGNGSNAFYMVSSPLIGFLAGYAGKKSSSSNAYAPFIKPIKGSLVAVGLECIQLLFIGIFSREGWPLVQLIALPMILLNSVGTFIFLSTIVNTLIQEEQARAVQTHDVLALTMQTLPYLRSGLEGLKGEKAQELATMIKASTKVSAVSLTNQSKILAHVGAGIDHHFPSHDVITELSREVIESGQMRIAHSKSEIGCTHPDCPLEAAIVVPLKSNQQVLGSMKLYFTNPSQLSYVEEQLARGLGAIFSMQLELGEAQLQSKLLQDAEIKSLQAQVNPHFFFNTINTILAVMRFDHDRARQLLLQLTTYFRHNLQASRQTKIPVEKELEHLYAYLSLNDARFPDRYHIELDMPEALNQYLLPPLCIQVLVENAIRHAFPDKKDNNTVVIEIKKLDDQLEIVVADNGVGIEEDQLQRLGKESVESKEGTGTALENLARRIENLYGDKGSFQAANRPTGGARFTLTFPLELANKED
ncbi:MULTISPECIES: sensor histidine kinase [Aerococcus]|uniref:histidine kinase n=1 Tax=Aerococcus tenax TaxID=3078812 RepID=A0A5N1BLZ5_9LACT|nr:sensor histidine kinase [Aerococcus urinae]KAA9241107.1 sensor histidine kinase [Aerococcus urinae]MDK7302683.1 sensor histidine kinase [Aerococcus urinae]MDK7801533.1 sensor histidine kinase [Aerococcus urinae]MDK8654927.1 sensor histidine kinase [Aerococcus urinae]RAW04573.1 sensor histidine kinase [Aerococcus urinae]